MATNSWTNTNWVAMKILRLLVNKSEIAGQFTTGWNEEFKKEFAVGSAVTIKKPARFTIRSGMTYSAQNISRQTTTINLDQVFGCDFEWDDYEAAVNLERSQSELEKNYFEPVAAKLHQELESRCAEFAYQNTPNVFGVLGTDATAEDVFLDAEARLFEKSSSDGDHKLILTSRAMSTFLKNQAVQFQPSDEISRQYKKGVVGMAHGMEWFRSNSLYRHTAGTIASTYTVSGAGQSGSSLLVNCTSGDTWKKGDKLSIANVNFLNPNTLRVPAGNQVQHYTVLADVTATGATATLSIYPAIVGPGSPYQNVDALPANSAAITHWPGTSSPNGKSGTVNLLLTKHAFGLAGATFKMPKNVEPGSTMARDPNTGLGLRFTRWWDGESSTMKNRWDMCVGFGVLYADEAAVVIAGA